MNKVPFKEASYLAQVRRMRILASTALLKYPITTVSLRFIHHGENTTFEVKASNGRKYLLRIHRYGYHSEKAIQEELNWLTLLSKKGIKVPKPVLSKNGRKIEVVTINSVLEPRCCSLMEWIDGHFIRQPITPEHLFKIGQIIAQLQNHTPHTPVKHRHYWTAAGLCGSSPKLGLIDNLAGAKTREQQMITEVRKLVFKKLRNFEVRFPKRQGLIHADLHLGNIIENGESLSAIDFDDCGYGFHAYDLVIPLASVEANLSKKNVTSISDFKNHLLAGYQTHRTWDKNDENIFPYLYTARKLAMLGWLNSRSDNPRLKKHLRSSIEKALVHIKKEYEF